MSGIALKQAECLNGPQDGRTITVASVVALPERLCFASANRDYIDVYRARESSPGFTVYEYQGTEARA